MTIRVIQCVSLFLFLGISAKTISNDYEKERISLIREELTQALGGRLQLNEEENKLNTILKNLKNKYINGQFEYGKVFNMSDHYFTYDQDIETTKIYQIIRKMPKGASLHLHSTLAMDADYLLKLTYEDNLYICYRKLDSLLFQFSDGVPYRSCESGNWTLLSEIRRICDNVQEFDNELQDYFTLNREETINTDINAVWKKFNQVSKAIKELISYRPVREKFIYDILKRHYEDNVLYIEFRGALHKLYELDGQIHNTTYTAELYQQVTQKFKEKHLDFIGSKLIVTSPRSRSMLEVKEILIMTRRLKKQMPNMIAGFDLVGQEDMGKPLKDFLPALLEYKEDINYYFHAGETNWLGTSSDENMYDAILLGSKRIGHAYSLLKHPSLMSLIIEKDIALEVNLISNMVLSLVRDVRNHPLSTYMALNLPVVLSSDDPGAWNATPLSHDFFVAFVGATGVHSDLRMLKQLALNSIKYSTLDTSDKNKFFNVFQKRWKHFVDNTILDI